MPPQLLIGVSRKARLRRILRRLGFATGAVALCLLLSYTAFRRWTLMTPPNDDGPALPQAAEVETQGHHSRIVVGESWMESRDGIWRLHLVGEPRMMGHAHGLLAGPITARIEHHMQGLMRTYVTSPWRRWLLENAIRWRFRALPESLPPARLVELAAYSRTVVDDSELPAQAFQRLIYYHALHDMTQRLDGSPLIGCTAFAVWGKQTSNGHLLVGRNFDFEGGPIFDNEKAVLTFRTPGKHAFVSVAWPGMMGVVTGVNAQRLFISLNAARTDDPLQPGIPMAFLAREILENCSNIKEAIALIKKHQVMVPDAMLIADGKVPEAVVIELAPRSMATRRARSEAVGVANHFLDNSFKGDASNNWLKRYLTSEARYQRLMQLLKRFSGRFDVRTMAMVLRNRTGLDDEPLGLGNRNALDALIATHGVVVDLSDMVLWVSKGPHLIGPFVAVDLKPLFGVPLSSMEQPEAIPADILLDSPELKRFEMAQSAMQLARELIAGGHLTRAIDYAHRASLLAPDSHDTQKLMGDLLWKVGRIEEAKEYYRTFLKLHPPHLKDKEEVTARLNR